MVVSCNFRCTCMFYVNFTLYSWTCSHFDLFSTFLGYEDGYVCLCNIQDPKQPVLTYCPHERAVNKVAFSPRR